MKNMVRFSSTLVTITDQMDGRLRCVMFESNHCAELHNEHVYINSVHLIILPILY